METLLLICAIGLSRPDCTIETATTVVQGPKSTNLAQCGFVGQAYLADTALAAYVENGYYLKILCTSGGRANSAQWNARDHHPGS
jgi:hypothetical protein